MRGSRHLFSIIAAGYRPARFEPCVASLRCRASVGRFHFSVCNAHHFAGVSAPSQQKDTGLERACRQDPGKGGLIEGAKT